MVERPSEDPLDIRLSTRNDTLCEQAAETEPDMDRERLIRMARQAETAAHIGGWLKSPSLRPPK